jgi:hypothetical protein
VKSNSARNEFLSLFPVQVPLLPSHHDRVLFEIEGVPQIVKHFVHKIMTGNLACQHCQAGNYVIFSIL